MRLQIAGQSYMVHHCKNSTTRILHGTIDINETAMTMEEKIKKKIDLLKGDMSNPRTGTASVW